MSLIFYKVTLSSVLRLKYVQKHNILKLVCCLLPFKVCPLINVWVRVVSTLNYALTIRHYVKMYVWTTFSNRRLEVCQCNGSVLQHYVDTCEAFKDEFNFDLKTAIKKYGKIRGIIVVQKLKIYIRNPRLFFCLLGNPVGNSLISRRLRLRRRRILHDCLRDVRWYCIYSLIHIRGSQFYR